MAESVKTFQAHLTAVMDSLVRASVCEITKLFQDTVNDYLVEISLNRKENEALKLRLRLTENKLRNERKYGMCWAASRRAAGLLGTEDTARKTRRMDLQSKSLTTSGSLACVVLWCSQNGVRNHNGDLLLSFRFLSPSSPPLFHSSLPLLFSSLPPSSPPFFLSLRRQAGEGVEC